MMAKQPGATATVDALLEHMRVGRDFLSKLVHQALLDLFRELRTNQEKETELRRLLPSDRGFRKRLTAQKQSDEAKRLILG